jgi:hypothetical protein
VTSPSNRLPSPKLDEPSLDEEQEEEGAGEDEWPGGNREAERCAGEADSLALAGLHSARQADPAVDGDADKGKSLLTLDLAARVTTGRAFPDGASFRQVGFFRCLFGRDAGIRTPGVPTCFVGIPRKNAESGAVLTDDFRRFRHQFFHPFLHPEAPSSAPATGSG